MLRIVVVNSSILIMGIVLKSGIRVVGIVVCLCLDGTDAVALGVRAVVVGVTV